jgi:hypothetical protein
MEILDRAVGHLDLFHNRDEIRVHLAVKVLTYYETKGGLDKFKSMSGGCMDFLPPSITIGFTGWA